MPETNSPDPKLTAALAMRAAIAKVATGPEYSKDLSFDEAKGAMDFVLSEENDPIQTAVFFIGLRMKRETDDENKGILQSIKDTAITAQANVDELVDIADPYDGHARGLPMSAFIAPVLAANGVAAVCHGLDYVGPKQNKLKIVLLDGRMSIRLNLRLSYMTSLISVLALLNARF